MDLNKLYIARNEKMRSWILDKIKVHDLPFRLYIERLERNRSINQNDYLHGIVFKMISEHTGHSLDEVKEGYLSKFNVGYYLDNKGRWRLRTLRTSEMTTISFETFSEWVRADAAIEMNLYIPLPMEVFVEELKFHDENKTNKETV
jgi:hypothetical protein